MVMITGCSCIPWTSGSLSVCRLFVGMPFNLILVKIALDTSIFKSSKYDT